MFEEAPEERQAQPSQPKVDRERKSRHRNAFIEQDKQFGHSTDERIGVQTRIHASMKFYSTYPLNLWYFHNKEERRGIVRRAFRSNIQVSDRLRVGLDELTAGVYRIAHQHIERAV